MGALLLPPLVPLLAACGCALVVGCSGGGSEPPRDVVADDQAVADAPADDAGLAPTFANVHAQILTGCSPASCHGSDGPESGRLMLGDEPERAAVIHGNLVNVAAATDVPERAPPNVPFRVVPGDPDRSFLYWKVLGHNPANPAERVVGERMPPFLDNHFNAAQLDLLRRWIAAGAPLD